jgi:hypothetical protein
MWTDLKASSVGTEAGYVDNQARGMTDLVRLNSPAGIKSRQTDAYIRKDMRTERSFRQL